MVLPASPDAVARQSIATLAKGSKSFRLASFFLPVDARVDAAVVYAFCRRVDDAVDDAPTPAEARAAVERLHDELHGRAHATPELQAFVSLMQGSELHLRAAEALIEGVASDIGEVRVPDDRGLVRYAHGVAGTVGLLMCRVIGVTAPRALPFALDLGIAMQITNICRDVAADAQLGRIYLPADRLARAGAAGVTPATLQAPDETTRAAVVRVVADLLALADRYYRSADLGMRYIPWRTRLAMIVASRIYRRIGVKLTRAGGDPLPGRTVVGALEKLWTLCLALAACLTPTLLGLGREPRHEADLHRGITDLPGADPG
jgi:phytoene synthase